MTNSKKLKAKIVENGMTQAKITQQLGISTTDFNNKLLNRSSFKSEEMFNLCNILNIEEAKSIFLFKIVNKNHKKTIDSRIIKFDSFIILKILKKKVAKCCSA